MKEGQKAIVWFDEVTRKDIPLVGGKGANLGDLTGKGFPVPPGFVVSAAACQAFFRGIDLHEHLDVLSDSDPETQTAHCTKIQRLIHTAQMQSHLEDAILAAHADLVELRGEKIDIIPWHADSARFVCNALAPAEISRVIIDEESGSMEVIVPDEFLSVAIGKRGQNVRLASKLTGWHLDVNSESSYSEAMRSGYDSLVELSGIGISMADALYEKGFFSAEELSKASIEDLIQIRGIGEEKAMQLVEKAKQYVAQLQQAAVAEEALENDEALIDAESDIDKTTEAVEDSGESLVAEDTDTKDN